MKFLQVGDTHVGYRQYGIRAREGDFRDAFGRIVALAIKHKVDAVVFTGDTFESSRPTVMDLNYVREKVLDLRAAGIAPIGIEGNHDATQGEILKAIAVQPLGRACIKGITFHGIDYCNKTEFAVRLGDVDDQVDVLVMHQTLDEIAELFGDVSAADIVRKLPNLRYVSLGHIHNPQTIHRPSEGSEEGCYFTYNGSTEMNEISESNEKTIPLVTVTKAKTTTKLLPLESRKVVKVGFTTEDEVEEFHSHISNYRDHLIYIVADTKVTKKVSAVLKDAPDYGILYTLSTVSGTANIDITKVKTWERSRSTVDLKKIIQEDFGEMVAEQSVVTNLLESPDNMKKITEDHIDAIRKESDNPGEGILQPGDDASGEVPTGELRERPAEPSAETTDEPETQGLIC